MSNNNTGLNFSNFGSESQPIIEEMKPVSLAELLAGHNHGEDEHHEHDEHDHDFAGSDSSSESEQISVSANVINPPTATINVNYDGFSDEAKNAFEYAVTIWEGWIKSDVAIEVDAYWQDLSQYGSGVLGAASPYSFKRNFTGATEDDTYYAMPLANHLAGKDLNGNNAEIEAWFNSDFSNWYFGTDGNTPAGKYDFTTVVLHELGHGFGLTDFINYDNGEGSYGNTIFESFVVNSENQRLDSFTNNSKELGAQLTSNDLFFNGANATQANGGERVKLYAPGKWEYGSSVAHLDEKTYPKGDAALMTPYFKGGEAIHNPGAITLAVLEDLGWDINNVDTKPVIEVTPQASFKVPSTQPVETPLTQASIIKIEESKLTSYAGQDKDSILTISDNNQELEINRNGWKKLALDYSISEKTIFKFEFQSDIRGEIQGIGFDTDDKFGSKTDKKLLFQLEGTDKLGISDFKKDITGQGWQTYQITVGDYFSGNVNYLTFVNDHDKGDKNAVSKFRNLRLYEEGQQFVPQETPITPLETPNVTPVETPLTQVSIIKIEESKLTSYAGQDKDSIFTISDNNQEIKISRNGWKKLALDYSISEKTIFKFEFQSDIRGEIQGIGFDTDDKFGSSNDKKRLFQLEGTDKLGISDFKKDITGQGWQTYQITVGDYFSGNVNYLTFVNDHDKGDKNAVSKFRNLRLYEEGQQFVPEETPIAPLETPNVTPVETPLTQASIIKIEESKLTSYAGQDKDSIFTISDNNQEIKISRNGWHKLALDYSITEKTILEFEFQSDIRGEIQGIGFDTDDKFGSSNDKKRLFQLEGTDKLGISDFKKDITGQGWQTYQITVGDYFSGNVNYLTFVNDHDKGDKNAVSKFRNLKLHEGDTNKLSQTNTIQNSDFTLTIKDSTNNFNLSSYGGIAQDKGKFRISDDKTEVNIEGNSWNKLDINNYNVTENTVLKFEFQSNGEAEIQGIGFDNDDIINGGDRAQFFQVSGTQDWGIELEDSYTLGSGWQTYEVNLGDYISGNFNYLTFANDNDTSNSTAQSQFRNISLSEMG